ncbi:MAG: tryptophan--tRNA ligase [Proteobacteria bacterium]|nr:tryptophan--tRNA ligase [Pseudomonadota bacterium]
MTHAPSPARRKRILSGMRPTGKLHIGHLLGAIENWKHLQDDFDCFYMVADWHALTTGYRRSADVKDEIREIVLDYLAGGVDPERCTFYVQSDVPEIAHLHLLLSMITPVGWLERVPTYKDQVEALGSDVATYGFLGYPVLMTTDIIMFKAEVVPVGQDQVAHLELCREIVRRFNTLYRPVFPEPQPRLTRFAAVPGLDGRKMSKSYGNDLLISDPPEVIEKKMKTAITDPSRVYRRDPGRPELCTVYQYHKMYAAPEVQREVFEGCRAGALGCVDCKKKAAASVVAGLAPIQEKRRDLAERPGVIEEMLSEGARRAREVASATLEEARDAMGLARTRS